MEAKLGADIQWHVGTIRFGPEFKSHKTRDSWAGKVTLQADLYDLGLCHLFVIAGKVSVADHRAILRLCRDLGYSRMHEIRDQNGSKVKLETDLTRTPFRRKRVVEVQP